MTDDSLLCILDGLTYIICAHFSTFFSAIIVTLLINRKDTALFCNVFIIIIKWYLPNEEIISF